MKSGRKIALWACCVFAALAVLIIALLPSYTFSGLVCAGIAAVTGFYLLAPRLPSKWGRPLVRLFTAALCLGLLLAAVTGAVILKDCGGDGDGEFDYLIVLGAGVNGTVPSMSLRDRIDAAYEYLTAHPEVICVPSGGQGPREQITEGYCIYRELTAMGIDPERIWVEEQATSTQENFSLSLALIEEKTGARPQSVGVVSSEYHLCRAKMIGTTQGVTAFGVPAQSGRVSLFVNYFLREIVAVWAQLLKQVI